jgi:DNA-binding beta-propeller fold protein YncE
MRIFSKTSALVGTVLLATGLASVTPAEAQTQEPEYVYATVQGDAQIAVVDATTLEEVERIDLQALGFSENAKPHHIAVDPDGSHWYVSLIGDNRVLKFDRMNRLLGQAQFEVPGLLIRAPDSNRLYVGRSMAAVNPPTSIGEIDTETMLVERADVFFPRPHAIEYSPELGRIFSASLAQNQMGSIDAESFDMEVQNLEGPVHTLVQFAISPDASTLVATGEMTGQLLIFDLADPTQPSLRASVSVGARPWHPIFSDERTVWFALKGENAVVAVDIESAEVVQRVEAVSLLAPHGSTIADGKLFVTSNGPGGMQMGDMPMADAPADAPPPAMDHAAMGHEMGETPTTGTLTVIDLETLEVVAVLELGANVTGVGSR